MEKRLSDKLKLFIGILCLGCSTYLGAQITVSGVVTESDNSPVIGASIYLDGSSVGTITDLDGSYSLNIPDTDVASSVLVYKYVGYTTQRIPISSDLDYSNVNVVLLEDALALDEVVITGSFTGRTQKEAPMSLTVLNGKSLERLANSSQADVLRTVPGITAEGGGGEVATNLFVRGFPSGGQYAFTPLQIDGIPILTTFGLNSSAHDVFFRNDIGLKSLEFV